MHDDRDRAFVRTSIDQGLSSLQENPFLAQRVMARPERKKDVFVKRKLIVSLVLSMTALMMISAALAAVLFPDLILMLHLQDRPEAADMVESVEYTWETEYVSARVREMLYDGHGVYILTDVIPKKDAAIMLPSGVPGYSLKKSADILNAEDSLPGETIAEYAERKGLPVVYARIAAQNEDRTFFISTQPVDCIHNADDDSWTYMLHYPTAATNDQIRVRLYTTVYDAPVTQAALSPDDPQRPLSEPHSILVPVSAMKDITPEVSERNVVSMEGSLKEEVSVRYVRAYHTSIANYLEIAVDSPGEKIYSGMDVVIQPTGKPLSDSLYTYTSDNGRDPITGRTSGYLSIATSDADTPLPAEFDVVVRVTDYGSYSDHLYYRSIGSVHVILESETDTVEKAE